MISLRMTDAHSGHGHASRERRLTLGLLTVIVIVRSAVFVFWPQSHFDSDQAVTGLMAKHLGQLRAFPVFWYGQSYLLAVEAWLAAPLFAVFGASVTALKLPLLAMNLAIVWLIVRILERDAGLRPAYAGVAASFFAITPPITTALLLTANGGNVEPCLYVLLLWLLRERPFWFGVVLGVGFLNREFTIYGFLAILLIQAVRRTLFTRLALQRLAIVVATAAVVWVLAHVAKQYSSAAGPGTSVADLYRLSASNNVAEILRRACINPGTFAAGVRGLFTDHYPQLFGATRTPLVDFGIESKAWQGMRFAGAILASLVLLSALRIAAHLAAERKWRDEYTAFVYLVLVGLLSSLGYIVGRCGQVTLHTMRYELLSVLGLVGLSGWYLCIERTSMVRNVWLTLAALVLSVSAWSHARLIGEYLTRPPVAPKQTLGEQLISHRIRYAYSDFWVAYYVTFMTRERVIVAADDAVRIRTFNNLVDAHRSQAVRISRRACDDGERITEFFWICRP